MRVLLGDPVIDMLVSSDIVIDFGCGAGEDAVELARLGCKRVIGVDIQRALLIQAAELASKAGVSERVTFCESSPNEGADAIVSLDAFEHFGDPAAILSCMHSALRPGGKRCMPLLGRHGITHSEAICSRCFRGHTCCLVSPALCAWRSHLRDDGAVRFSEVAGGLNQMTIGRFERLVHQSQLRLECLESVPIRVVTPLHNRMTREFTTAIVRATLVRPIA